MPTRVTRAFESKHFPCRTAFTGEIIGVSAEKGLFVAVPRAALLFHRPGPRLFHVPVLLLFFLPRPLVSYQPPGLPVRMGLFLVFELERIADTYDS